MQKKGLLGLIANLQEVLACLVQLAAFPGAASKSPGSSLTSHHPREGPVLCTALTTAREEIGKKLSRTRKEEGDLELKGSLSYFLSEPRWIKTG